MNHEEETWGITLGCLVLSYKAKSHGLKRVVQLIDDPRLDLDPIHRGVAGPPGALGVQLLKVLLVKDSFALNCVSNTYFQDSSFLEFKTFKQARH